MTNYHWKQQNNDPSQRAFLSFHYGFLLLSNVIKDNLVFFKIKKKGGIIGDRLS